MLKVGGFPLFDNIFTGNILGMYEMLVGGFTLSPHARVLLPRAFLKLMIMIKHKKIMQIPYLDKWSMLLSGQVTHRSNSSHLFWNLKDHVLVQKLSYRRRITCDLLLIGFFYKLISV